MSKNKRFLIISIILGSLFSNINIGAMRTQYNKVRPKTQIQTNPKFKEGITYIGSRKNNNSFNAIKNLDEYYENLCKKLVHTDNTMIKYCEQLEKYKTEYEKISDLKDIKNLEERILIPAKSIYHKILDHLDKEDLDSKYIPKNPFDQIKKFGYDKYRKITLIRNRVADTRYMAAFLSDLLFKVTYKNAEKKVKIYSEMLDKIGCEDYKNWQDMVNDLEKLILIKNEMSKTINLSRDIRDCNYPSILGVSNTNLKDSYINFIKKYIDALKKLIKNIEEKFKYILNYITSKIDKETKSSKLLFLKENVEKNLNTIIEFLTSLVRDEGLLSGSYNKRIYIINLIESLQKLKKNIFSINNRITTLQQAKNYNNLNSSDIQVNKNYSKNIVKTFNPYDKQFYNKNLINSKTPYHSIYHKRYSKKPNTVFSNKHPQK